MSEFKLCRVLFGRYTLELKLEVHVHLDIEFGSTGTPRKNAYLEPCTVTFENLKKSRNFMKTTIFLEKEHIFSSPSF